jgi:hypothetical protein
MSLLGFCPMVISSSTATATARVTATALAITTATARFFKGLLELSAAN